MYHKFSELSCALEKDQLAQSQFSQFSELICYCGLIGRPALPNEVCARRDYLGHNSFEVDSIYKSLFVISIYDVMAGMYTKLSNIY